MEGRRGAELVGVIYISASHCPCAPLQHTSWLHAKPQEIYYIKSQVCVPNRYYSPCLLFIEKPWNSISRLPAHLPKILDTSPEKQIPSLPN